MCINYGLTGVLARCTGIKRDLRLDKLETYANYYYLNFRSFIGQNGDSYDRFLIRMNEMTESLNIMNQVIYKLLKKRKIKKIKKNSDINPHHILKYLYPKS
jgi:NADH:ubiquinone oxidoreductase subunit D